MPTHHIPEIATVDINDPTDVALWALVIEADPGDVVEASTHVGADPEAIRKYLKNPTY